MMKFKPVLIVILFFLLFSFEAEAQCAMCRAVLESEADGSKAEAINDGIMYLMVFPYLLMAGVAYAIWRIRKKTKA